MMNYLLTLICVVGIAIGQVMFKLTAVSINKAGTPIAWEPAWMFLATCVLYGVTSVGWVLILRQAELSKVYPIMALAFVIVPIMSHFIFGERFNVSFMAGTCLIIVGIILTVWSSK